MPIYDLNINGKIAVGYVDSAKNIAVSSRIAHFGTGDILVVHAKESSKSFCNEIALLQRTPHEIGSKSEGEMATEINAPIRLIFDNRESVRVLMDELGELWHGMTQ